MTGISIAVMASRSAIDEWRICAGVKDHAIGPVARFMEMVDQDAFVIGLRRSELDLVGIDMLLDGASTSASVMLP